MMTEMADGDGLDRAVHQKSMRTVFLKGPQDWRDDNGDNDRGDRPRGADDEKDGGRYPAQKVRGRGRREQDADQRVAARLDRGGLLGLGTRHDSQVTPESRQ